MDNRGATGRLGEEQGQALVALARKTIADRLKNTGRREKESGGDYRHDSPLEDKRGVFVTLHRHGRLRGCIGNLGGVMPITDGVRHNAVSAAFHDPRFSPVTAAELDEIAVEVSILSEPQPIAYDGPDDLVGKLQPGVDGVVIRKGVCSATFLPQVWQQLPETEQFLSHLCQKAGLSVDEWRRGELKVFIYQVQYFKEDRQG